MSYIRSRKFCCCLPVRLGVFVLTITGAALCGLIAAYGWMEIITLKNYPLTTGDKIALYVATGVYTLGCLVSVFGLIGALFKRRRLVSLYATALAFQLAFLVVSGSVSLFFLFRRDRAQLIQECVSRADSVKFGSDSAKESACDKGFALVRGVSVGAFVLVCLIELYGVIITWNYVGQLEEEEALKAPSGRFGAQQTTAYQRLPVV